MFNNIMTMKNNKLKYISISLLCSLFIFSSCLDDLNTMPLDDNKLVGDQVYKEKEGYIGLLAKCYASLILTGQEGGDGGNGDLEGANEGYSGYSRSLFYLQELSTDNFVMPSSSNGLRHMLNMTWTESNAGVIKWTYQRLYMSIAYCNEFLRESTESKLNERGLYNEMKDEYLYYRAEASFIRAYCYAMLCDLFGNVPYIDEKTSIKDIPVQLSRKEVFDFAEGELLNLQNKLKEPGKNEYGRIDRVAAWFLLSRMYLNANSWIGLDKYQDAFEYAKKVIDSNAYPLASDYRHIFLADNNTCKEIIWPLVQDGIRAQSSAGTNFYVKAFVNGPMDGLYKTGVGSKGWGNVRAKTTLVNAFHSDDVLFDKSDPWGNNKSDKRAMFMTALDNQKKNTWDDNNEMTNTFTCGYGYIKWRNVTKENQLSKSGDTYTSIDFPLFRTGEAYLTASEAILRGANAPKAMALEYVNKVRSRAYMSDEFAKENISSEKSGRIALDQLTLDFLLDERQRELASELTRRTDLIRFGVFTKNNNWDWKGGQRLGKDVDDFYHLFPIPDSEMTNNPNLVQNEGYN